MVRRPVIDGLRNIPCKCSTCRYVWVSCESGARGGKGVGWTETGATFTLRLPPPTPPCPTAAGRKNLDLSSFQRIPFSRPHSPEDPGGPGSDCERQRVRKEDQHRDGEDLHPARLQLLCRRCQGPRCLPGDISDSIKFHRSLTYFKTFAKKFRNFPNLLFGTFFHTLASNMLPSQPPLLIHRVTAGDR